MTTFVINKDNSTAIKGVCCILIVLHHYFQASGMMRGMGISAFFIAICGYVSVAVFFFLSGYGLTESEQWAKLTWNQFVKKRISRVYTPFVVTNLFFLLLLILLKQYSGDWIKGIKHVIGIELIDSITWFVPVLLLFYVFTQLLSPLKCRYLKGFGIVGLTTFYSILGFSIINIPFYAIVSVPAFAMGYLTSLFKREIVSLLLYIKVRLLLLVISGVGVIIFSLINMGYINVPQHIIHISIALNNIFVLLFIVALFAGHDVCWFKCDWLGKISYEVYLTHAKVFTIWIILTGTFMPIWVLFVIFPIAFAINIINIKLLAFIK